MPEIWRAGAESLPPIRRGRSQTGPRAHTVRPYGEKRTRSVGSETQAQTRDRSSFNFLKTQAPSGAGRDRTQALLIPRAGRILPTPRGNPRKWGPGPTPPVRGRCRVATEGIGWAAMSTKCSSKPSPAAFWFLCRRGQRNSPPAGGEIPRRKTPKRPDEGIGPYKCKGQRNITDRAGPAKRRAESSRPT